MMNFNSFDFLQDFIESERKFQMLLFSFSRYSSRLLLFDILNPFIWSQIILALFICSEYSLQLGEHNDDVGIRLSIPTTLCVVLCFHFVSEGFYHLMSWKFSKISLCCCFVTATFSDWYVVFMSVVSSVYVCGIAKGATCDWVEFNRIFPARHILWLGNINFLPQLMCSDSLDHGGPRRSKNKFNSICRVNYVNLKN